METKHSAYRLPAHIKSKLSTLAKLDDTSETDVIKRLINKEYKARQDEIREFRINLKNKNNMADM